MKTTQLGIELGRLAENVRTYLTDRKIVGVMGVFKDKEYDRI